MLTNAQLEEAFETLPEEVSKALQVWRKATIERETKESELFLDFKKKQIANGGAAGDDYIKHLVRANEERRLLCECEAAAEAIHSRLYERLLGAKKTASIRGAF